MSIGRDQIAAIEALNVALVGVGAGLGWLGGFLHVPSFVLGGAVMHVNFWLLKRVVRSLFAASEESAAPRGSHRLRTAGWLAAKLAFFFLLSSAVIVRYPVEAGSFAAGVPLLLIACVITSLRRGAKPSAEADTADPSA